MVKCSYTDIPIVKLTLYYNNNNTYNALLRTITAVICNKGVGLFLFGDKNLPKRVTDLTMSTSYTACASKIRQLLLYVEKYPTRNQYTKDRPVSVESYY